MRDMNKRVVIKFMDVAYVHRIISNCTVAIASYTELFGMMMFPKGKCTVVPSSAL